MITKASLVNLYTCVESSPGIFAAISVEVARIVAPVRVKMETFEFQDGIRQCVDALKRATQAGEDSQARWAHLRRTMEHLGNHEAAKRMRERFNAELARARAAAQRATD